MIRAGPLWCQVGPQLLILVSIALLLSSRIALCDHYYDDPYSEPGWNETGDGDLYGAAYAYPGGRGLGGAYDDEGPRSWSVSMGGEDGAPGEAGAAAGGLDAGAGGTGGAAAYATPAAAARRGHVMGGAAAHGGMAGRGGPGGVGGAGAGGVPGSCPGGVCPNPGMYEEDLHFDPRYPYDNCQYVGSFDTFQLNGTETCHMLVQGVDGHADRLEGGMDGTYLLAGCFEGKPLYMRSRRSGPPGGGEDRVLYFNPHFGAWEFAVGKEPNVDQLVLAGDEGHVSPIDVPRWRLAAAFNAEQAALLPSDDEELYYVAAGVSVMCAGEGDDSLLGPDERKQLQAQRAAAGLEAEGDEEGAEEEQGGAAGIGRGEAGEEEAGAAGKGGGKGWGGKKPPAQQAGGRAGGKAGGRGAAAAGGRGGRASARGDAAASAASATSLGGRTGRARAVGGDVELEAEVVELREYWQQHEEEFYESRYQYGDSYAAGGYDDGRQGYDDEYGPYGY
ncbi:hypothetical protein HXX76_000416 [Chlamydomonas incerta]|uniref:Uncharacterized protein n=1 Tax=Chlamydomonas incerta TaxID=51695 RepID=A0A835WE83_CHLIN|nr:hypothetical protein HXX76_000416 [Chlamydomonas incerta]|eukprot:KAG2445812.1 hypothetical protein HXX76_000416 [Chlamydomonas incerta]